MDDRLRVKISKFLSLVLRHRPEKVGVALDEGGWVSVAELLAGCAQAGRTITTDQLGKVVATNDKRRFELSPDGQRIRRQGHSVRVDLGHEPTEPPDVLYHGTVGRNLGAIRAGGLVRGRRHHVHLSGDVETARRVGQRRGRAVVLTVEAGRMHADGFEFFLSGNGVWLTDRVPPEYLEFPEVPAGR